MLTNHVLTALDLLRAGYSILPIELKSPPYGYLWKHHQSKPMTEREAVYLFGQKGFNIALICGAVSGNLLCIDFDRVELWHGYLDHLNNHGFALPEPSVIVQTKQGYHLWMRSTGEVGRNRVLATDTGTPKKRIETRAEGGYARVTGENYTVISGSFLTLTPLDTELVGMYVALTALLDEREANVLCEGTSVASKPEEVGSRPGDKYNASTDYYDLLRSNGWKQTGRHKDMISWCRPGKDKGISATSNYKGSNRFFVFSTSCPPFEAGRSYSPWSVFGLLQCNGDWSEAGRLLRRRYA